MHVQIYIGNEKVGWFNTTELWTLGERYAASLQQPPLFHDTTRRHEAPPEVLRAALPELQAGLQRMREQGYHEMAAPPTRAMGEPPPPRWLYDTLELLIQVFEQAIRVDAPIIIE